VILLLQMRWVESEYFQWIGLPLAKIERDLIARGAFTSVSIDDRYAPYTKVRKMAIRHRTCSAQADHADVEVAKYSLTGLTKSKALS
jgi:hypothetical protein